MRAALSKTVFSWGKIRQERHAMLSFAEPVGSLREMRRGAIKGMALLCFPQIGRALFWLWRKAPSMPFPLLP